MKRFSILLAFLFTFFTTVRSVSAATTRIDLGTADSFAVLAGTAVTNVPTSVISGDLGLSPAAGSNYGAGVTTAQVSGIIYAVDASGPAGSTGNNPGLMTTAKSDLTAAYLDAAGRTPTSTFGTTDNQWLYNTNVLGFSTEINSLPNHQPIWTRVAARSACMIGDYGEQKLVGGPGLPDTGFSPYTSFHVMCYNFVTTLVRSLF